MSEQIHNILAIESAIGGGSLSLLKDGIEVGNWIGESNVSKAEDLLVNIDDLLTTTNISRKEIDLVAVSAGPGSFTGIRIGLATALGLKAGLDIQMASESALTAMVWARPTTSTLTAALPVGRNSICLQEFHLAGGEVAQLNDAFTMPDHAFFQFLRNEKDREFLLHGSLYERCEATPLITNFGTNIAFAIGTICGERPGSVIEPLFISKSV